MEEFIEKITSLRDEAGEEGFVHLKEVLDIVRTSLVINVEEQLLHKMRNMGEFTVGCSPTDN